MPGQAAKNYYVCSHDVGLYLPGYRGRGNLAASDDLSGYDIWIHTGTSSENGFNLNPISCGKLDSQTGLVIPDHQRCENLYNLY